uniref:Hexosyltransferase n=1 Tax=Odontella aurita TaxID=265563 RepID=A0A7S4HUT5_9STRA|mmetsp:Transcript_15387/g.44637  ORF Transcript_15387/g.44637 Transcript_15387/m.44637 type:complete len:381 (+) Transcript_15387:130-1272(+)
MRTNSVTNPHPAMAQYLNRRDARTALALLAGIAGVLALFGSSLDSFSLPSSISVRRGLETSSSSSQSFHGAADIDEKFGTVFLLGIFSDLTEDGARRRKLIRDTYLRVAREDGGRGRFCPLSEYGGGGGSSPCQVVYTFVVGGADPENGPTGLEAEEPSEPVLRPQNNAEESDVTYLNVREPHPSSEPEHAYAGKTAVWFRYASKLSAGEARPIDYVSKASSDTIISMDLLLDTVYYDLPPSPYNTLHYGGRLHPNLVTNNVHAGGSFYLASPDMALHAASKITDAEWRDGMIQKMAEVRTPATEDALFGAAVFTHRNPIKMITLAERVFWEGGLNTDEEWAEYWENKMGGLPRRERVLPMKEFCTGWFDSGVLQRVQEA